MGVILEQQSQGRQMLQNLSTLGNQSGWRQAAVYILGSMYTSTLLLTLLLIISASSARSLTGELLLFEGDCRTTTTLNIVLHAVLNILGCVALGGANYFLQIFTFPIRADIDKAHSSSEWLEIGIASPRNLIRMRRLRRLLVWTLLALTSIPIHLFLNSVVFSTDVTYDYIVVRASESFINSRNSYSFPGVAQLPGMCSKYRRSNGDDARSGITSWRYGNGRNITYRDGRGPMIGLNKGLDWAFGSDVSKANMPRSGEAIVQLTAAQAPGWERLDGAACGQEYRRKDGIRDRRHLLVIVDSMIPNERGWARQDVWGNITIDGNWTYDLDCASQERQLNSLWDWAAYGVHSNNDAARTGWLSPRWLQYLPSADDGWHIANLQSNVTTPTPRYCLSQKAPEKCKLQVSNTLLVVICSILLVKTLFCTKIATTLWNQTPLATLGDSIASFMDAPDPYTTAMSACGFDRFQKLRRKAKRGNSYAASQWQPTPVRWQSSDRSEGGKLRRTKILGQVVPLRIWITTYAPFLAAYGAALYFLLDALQVTNPMYQREGIEVQSRVAQSIWQASYFGPSLLNSKISFSNGAGNFFSLPQASVLANTAHLVVSFCSLFYNNLITRMCIAKEWTRFSGKGYQPLRVTHPQGAQYSTYRLQIPYRFAISLMGANAALHTLLSSAVYLSRYQSIHWDDESGLSSDRTSVGFSIKSIAAVLVLSTVLLLVPVLMSFWPIPKNSIVVGSCSAAIAAACHPLDSAGLGVGTKEGAILDSPSGVALDNEDSSQLIYAAKPLSQRRMRWGVVRSPVEGQPIEILNGEQVNTGQLSLAVEGQDNVGDPQAGEWYA